MSQQKTETAIADTAVIHDPKTNTEIKLKDLFQQPYPLNIKTYSPEIDSLLISGRQALKRGLTKKALQIATALQEAQQDPDLLTARVARHRELGLDFRMLQLQQYLFNYGAHLSASATQKCQEAFATKEDWRAIRANLIDEEKRGDYGEYSILSASLWMYVAGGNLAEVRADILCVDEHTRDRMARTALSTIIKRGQWDRLALQIGKERCKLEGLLKMESKDLMAEIDGAIERFELTYFVARVRYWRVQAQFGDLSVGAVGWPLPEWEESMKVLREAREEQAGSGGDRCQLEEALSALELQDDGCQLEEALSALELQDDGCQLEEALSALELRD